MNEIIGGYRRLTEFTTAGSGTSRWCLAVRGNERFFIKQFLTPVFPRNPSSPLGALQLARCVSFEEKKKKLYTAVSCVLGECVVPVVDFFRYKGHYFTASQALDEDYVTLQHGCCDEKHYVVLSALALALLRMHTQGIVHGDIKPEHVMILPGKNYQVRLIDYDSGFVMNDTMPDSKTAEGDPQYLAPEMYRLMTGDEMIPTNNIDTFAFGLLIHQVLTGRLPVPEGFSYMHEAVLAGEAPVLAPELPQDIKELIRNMLSEDPSVRPSDQVVLKTLEKYK